MSIIFLHTSETHISTFDDLLDEIAPEMARRHLVMAAFLAEARQEGKTAVLQQRVHTYIQNQLTTDPRSVLVCTCSTIGKMAETAVPGRVIRIDRPMLEEAVRIGGRIELLATVESTLTPTIELLKEVAGERHMDVGMTAVLEAWPHFESGNMEAYFHTIAQKIDQIANAANVIVLAQASMAGATQLSNTDVPVLCSPRLGVEAGVVRWRGLFV